MVCEFAACSNSAERRVQRYSQQQCKHPSHMIGCCSQPEQQCRSRSTVSIHSSANTECFHSGVHTYRRMQRVMHQVCAILIRRHTRASSISTNGLGVIVMRYGSHVARLAAAVPVQSAEHKRYSQRCKHPSHWARWYSQLVTPTPVTYHVASVCRIRRVIYELHSLFK